MQVEVLSDNVNFCKTCFELCDICSNHNFSGTLQDDVRGDLLEEVMKRGWQFSSDVEFPTLAVMPVFKGHTPNSLSHLYGDMVAQVVGKKKIKGVKLLPKEVTATQVEEWWNSKTKLGKPFKRTGKTESKRKWEADLVSVYNEVVIELDLRHLSL